MNWLKHRARGTSLFHEIYDGPQKVEINPEAFEKIRALQVLLTIGLELELKSWLERFIQDAERQLSELLAFDVGE
ncbi:hypothetical protein [Endozoicomonas sp. YOMI1]|uniref:hypothetical protein n=1 Tax=Endozoicomonas sp. YOMI1 TaxID=2828739 RepID=UPI002147E984|nr:hypothetical protein [Endozoicomonas sp. YOMI1]